MSYNLPRSVDIRNKSSPSRRLAGSLVPTKKMDNVKTVPWTGYECDLNCKDWWWYDRKQSDPGSIDAVEKGEASGIITQRTKKKSSWMGQDPFCTKSGSHHLAH